MNNKDRVFMVWAVGSACTIAVLCILLALVRLIGLARGYVVAGMLIVAVCLFNLLFPKTAVNGDLIYLSR